MKTKILRAVGLGLAYVVAVFLSTRFVNGTSIHEATDTAVSNGIGYLVALLMFRREVFCSISVPTFIYNRTQRELVDFERTSEL